MDPTKNLKVDKRGCYSNRIIDESVNRGVKSKLTAEQLEERVELHARRQIYGNPTNKQIALHWETKYDIIMHEQSEKEWALNNKEWIEIKKEEMLKKGIISYPEVSSEGLINTLAVGAKSNAEVIKKLKNIIINELADFNKLEEKDKANKSVLVNRLATIQKTHSVQLIEMVKVAKDFSQRIDEINREAERKATLKKKQDILKAAEAAENDGLAEIAEVGDLEKLRKEAGIG